MIIALASTSVRDGDVAFNLSQMAKVITKAREWGAEPNLLLDEEGLLVVEV